MNTALARLSTARRVALYLESSRLYDRLRGRYRPALGTPDEARLLALLARAFERELRRAPRILH